MLKFGSTTWTLKVEIWDPLPLGELLAIETEPPMARTKKSHWLKNSQDAFTCTADSITLGRSEVSPPSIQIDPCRLTA